MDKIYKTDDNYKYCALGKRDDSYGEITLQIEEEITKPNIRMYGGKLYGTVGLYFPELLIYLKDIITDKIIGYIGLTEYFGKGLYISQIAVREQNRRTGVATTLVNEAARIADERGIDIISADIAPDNDASLEFFGKLGFVGKGRYFIDTQEYIEKNKTKNTEENKKTSSI